MTAAVIRGDARRLPLPDGCVDLIVTSPPYFGLRSYTDGGTHYAGQIGSEATPAEWLAALLECTAEWVRVLKAEGSLFVNLGDKYVADNRGSGFDAKRGAAKYAPAGPQGYLGRDMARHKSLLGLPWRYALACTDQLGLILRRDIIWSKPNGLPESVTDRCRSSHEYVFHLVKGPRYFSAVDEIREPHTGGTHDRRKDGQHSPKEQATIANGFRRGFFPDSYENPLGKLPGSVWTIPSQPLVVPPHLGVDHFAAFPMELPRRIILGWSPGGVCTGCGQGLRPVTDAVSLNMSRPQARRAQQLADRAGLTERHFAALLAVGVSDTGRGAATQSGTGKNTAEVYVLANEARAVLGGYAREYLLRRPTRFGYKCGCPAPDAPVRPALVLDPFGGTGTTALVATALGRNAVTIDLSADYCRLAAWRLSDPGERARALEVPKPPPVPDLQDALW